MRTPRHSRPRAVLAFAAGAACAALLAGCGSSGTAASADPPSSAAPAGYPAENVIASVAESPSLRAELAAAVPGVGSSLTLGTTLEPGTSFLPHVGTASGGQSVGVDVDLRDAVGRLLGITWSVQNGTFATIIPGVQNGRYQVGQDNFGVTAAREKVVDFATYLTDGQALLTSDGSGVTSVSGMTGLCGLTVGTATGTTFQQILQQDAGRCAAAGRKPYTVLYYADNATVLLSLANGRVDVLFGPTLSLKYLAAHVADVRFLTQISSTPVGFVTAKGSPLAKVLSDAVNTLITDGTYAKILAKWGITGSGIPTSRVDPVPTL